MWHEDIQRHSQQLVKQFNGPEIGNVSGKFLIQDRQMPIE